MQGEQASGLIDALVDALGQHHDSEVGNRRGDFGEDRGIDDAKSADTLDQVERKCSQIDRRDTDHDVVEEPRHHLPAEAAAEPPPTARAA